MLLLLIILYLAIQHTQFYNRMQITSTGAKSWTDYVFHAVWDQGYQHNAVRNSR